MKKLLFLSYFLLLALNSTSAQDYYFRRISMEQGLSQSSVFSMVQDSTGFIWIGTQDGLNRFDGHQFTVFRPEPGDSFSLPGEWVSALHVDDQSRLWVGTYNQGLARYEPSTGNFYTLTSPFLSDNRIWAMTSQPGGYLWIATDHGLNRYHTETGTNKQWLPATHSWLPSNHILAVLWLEKSRKLAAGTSEGVFIINPDSLDQPRVITPSSGLTNPIVMSLFEDESGDLLIGTANGLNRVNPHSAKVMATYLSSEMAEKSGRFASLNRFGDGTIRFIQKDTQGNYWLATDNGLKVLKPDGTVDEIVNLPGDARSLSNDLTRSMLVDRSGNLWIGTAAGGISTIDLKQKKFRWYQSQKGKAGSLSDGNIRSLLKDSRSRIWAGTLGGGLNMSEPGSNGFRVVPVGSNERGYFNVWSLAEDGDGNIWAGTSFGLTRLSSNLQKRDVWLPQPGNENSLPDSYVRSLCVASDGTLYIGTDRGLSILDRNRKQFRNFRPELNTGLTDGTIYSLSEDLKGMIWLGTASGLFRFNPKSATFRRWTAEPGVGGSLSNESVRAVYVDRKGNVWAGTNNGLNRMNADSTTFLRFGPENGLRSAYIYGIGGDGNGNIWVSTNQGIYRLNPETREVRAFSVQHGLQAMEFNTNAVFESTDGELFFGGINGFNSFYPDGISDFDFPAPVVISSIQVLDRLVPKKGDPNQLNSFPVDYDENVITLQAAALDYTNPESNRIEYFLDGFSREWRQATQNRTIVFTNLNPGDYILKIRGSNHDGFINPVEKKLGIIVQPPFWMTTWFRISLILLIAGITGLVIYIRLQIIQKQNRLLEDLVKKRTAQLESTLDDLKNAQFRLVESEKQASLGQLTAGLAHEMNNPLNFINSGSVTISENMIELADWIRRLKEGPVTPKESKHIDDLLAECKDLMKGIETGARRTADIVRDLRKFTRLDEAVIQTDFVHSGINMAISLLQHRLPDGIKVIKKFDKKLPAIELNHQELNQVFMAVLTNAIEAIGNSDGTITIQTEKDGDYISITIKDNGKGIPSEMLTRVFDPYFSTKPIGQHKGMGLTLSKSIISQMGGQLDLTSGKETVCNIRIPLKSVI